jgi:hypothetical protein
MRYFLILLLLFLIEEKTHSQNTDSLLNRSYINLSKSKNSNTPINNSLPLTCKVIRIKKNEKAYIIDVKEGNDYFTIISLKSEKQHLKKIKRGRQYEFTLFAYYPLDIYIIGDPQYSWGNIYTIDGVPISFKNDFKTGCIVTTKNLKGLYYFP